MRSVLGIDAAWTVRQPSGCALVSETARSWRLVQCAASYEHFAAKEAGEDCGLRARGSIPDAQLLIDACIRAVGHRPDLIAVDMPMALIPITGRRASDQAVSIRYGARGAGTHTPSAERPGRISDALRIAFTSAGYPLLVERITSPGLIEVYPHPALIELTSATKRLPYKIQRARKYWPNLTVLERREHLFVEWSKIVGLLDKTISGTAIGLPLPALQAPIATLKSFEDTLDAVVCAWVGVCALETKAEPLGDTQSAIWIPTVNGRRSQQ